MNPGREVLRADLLISDGRIAAVGRDLPLPPATRLVDVSGLFVLPGLIQGHVHLGQALFRGLAENRTLLPWLEERIWPLEAAHHEESAYCSGMLGAVDCLLSGTTTVNDIGLAHGTEGLARAVVDSGIRAILGPCLMDRGDKVPPTMLQTTSQAVALASSTPWPSDQPRLEFSLCPRFILSCSEELWRTCVEVHQDHGTPLHTHLLESQEEAAAAERILGRSQMEWLDSVGVLDTGLRAAHGVGLGAKELSVLEGRSMSVVHCPSSNLKLGSGVADLALLARSKEIALGIGCDGAPCNNTMDLLAEMRVAALLQNWKQGPGVVPARTVVEMATIEGARALGREGELGSLEPGKRGDLTVVDLSGPASWTGEEVDVYDALVYTASREQVRWVIVDGEVVVDHGEMPFVDLGRVVGRARTVLTALLQRAQGF